jgi:hypothetical protein
MPATLAQLITAQDQPTILANMYTLAASLGVDVEGVQAERMFRALYEIEATAKANEEQYRVNVTKGAFLDMASDVSPYSDVLAGRTTWLDLLAAGFFNLFRSPATVTLGVARFTASVLALSASIPAKRITIADAFGNQFQNLDAFTVTPGASVNVRVVAIRPGSTGNVANNTITTMVTTLGGVTVNNPAQAGTTSWLTTAGVDPEANANLVGRCRSRWSRASAGGGAAAYTFRVAEAFAHVNLANTVTRIAVDETNPLGPGSVAIYLANASGPATATEVSIVDVYLQPRKTLGMGTLLTAAATAFTVPLSITVYGSSNASAAAAAVASVFSSTQLGGRIFIDAITSALLALPGVFNAPIFGYTTGSYIQVPTGHVPVASLSLTMVP